MVRGFSLFEKALVVIEAQDWNVQWYTKALALVQMQFCCTTSSVMRKKKRATIQTSLDHFYKRAHRTESSKEPEPVPSTLGMRETATCPPFPIADDSSALPSPTFSLPPPLPSKKEAGEARLQVTLLAQFQPLYARCCTVLLYYCTFQDTVL